jgi:integrase
MLSGYEEGIPVYLRKAGIHDLRFHYLHHIVARRPVMARVDLPTLKGLTGHKTRTMTLRYVHFTPGQGVNASSMRKGSARMS